MNAHVDKQAGERLDGFPGWQHDGSVPRSIPRVRAVSPASIMVYCRATLEDYLTRHYRVNEGQAAEWLRNFIEDRQFAADRTGSAFRVNLGKSLHRFISQQLRPKRQARSGLARRIGGRSSEPLEPSSMTWSRIAREFNVAWARAILAECLRRMKRYCQASNQLLVWQAFENRVLRPMLHQEEPGSYTEFVDRFGLRSPSEAARVLLMGRQMFGQFLRSVVADYAETSRHVEAEIGELKGLLNGTR